MKTNNASETSYITVSFGESDSNHAVVKRIISLVRVSAVAVAALVFAAPHAGASPDGQAAVVSEDSAQWDCTTMGNQVCGPSNDQGVMAGQYEAGVLVPWSANEVPAWCHDICLGA